ncbi:MAG: tRNA (adenosine(37)-N6)-threonylcarbamoyltransferase complex ATPase subunit type 1 TsaE [bacterium]
MISDFSTVPTQSEEETFNLGLKLAGNIHTEILILVTGQLGVGKSVLIRGIAKGLGYDGRMRSPSYTIERVYKIPNGELHHWDLYRLEKQSEIEPVFEEIRMQSGIRLVEWGERLGDFVKDQFLIEMEYQDEPDSRLIKVDKRIAEI